MRDSVIACAMVCLLAASSAAEVLEHVTYVADRLPSQAGWRFPQDSDEEGRCRIQDGVLEIDTMGQPDFSSQGLAYYHRSFYVHGAEAETITVHLRARVLEIEASGNWRTSFAVVVDWTNPNGSGDHFGFAIAPLHLFRWYNGHSFADLDATQWHDYTMICDLVHGLMTVLVDGEDMGTYTVDPAQGSRRILFGDMMLNANARAEVERLEYIVEGSPPVAVTPTTWTAVRNLFTP